MISRHLLFAPLGLALLAGCGDSMAPDGASSASTTGPGAGGTPSAGPACSQIAFRGDVIRVDGDSAHDDDAPRLVATGDVGRVALTFERRLAGSASPFAEVRHTTFEPFGAWPVAVPAPVATPSIPLTISPALDVPPRIFAVTGAPGGALGLLTVDGPGQAAFHRGLDPLATTGEVIGVPGTAPIFATHDGETFVLGAQDAYAPLVASLVSVAASSPAVESWPIPCSWVPEGFDPSPAAAVPFEDGFLVASTHLGLGEPGCAAFTTFTTLLHRVRVGQSPVLVGGLDGYPVAVAPHPEGLWMAWPHQAEDGSRHIEIARVDGATGAVVAQMLADVDAEDIRIAIALMGRSLVLAWTMFSPPEVHVRVLSESGATVGEASLPGQDAPGAVSVIAAPDAGSMVVAWGQWASAGRISVARADCMGL